MEIFSYEIVPLEEDISSASNFEPGCSCSVDLKGLPFDSSEFCSTEQEIGLTEDVPSL